MTTNGHITTSAGKNDECYTYRYAVEPFRNKIIWCPFDKEDSEFVKVFQNNNFKVVFSHIDLGQDFYNYQPEKFDLIISNPPFTNKKEIFKRLLSFNKPFAVIMTILWLNDNAPYLLFKDKNLQLLMFNRRMEFKNQPKDKMINFKSAYFCRDFLPKDIIFRNLDKDDSAQLKLLSEE